jgi:hypothetical protein
VPQQVVLWSLSLVVPEHWLLAGLARPFLVQRLAEVRQDDTTEGHARRECGARLCPGLSWLLPLHSVVVRKRQRGESEGVTRLLVCWV